MYICSDHFTPESFLPIKGLGRRKLKPDAVPSIFPKFPQHLQVSPKPKWRSPKKCKIVEPPTPSKIAKEHLYACQSEFYPNKSKQEIVHLKKKVSVIFQQRVIEQGKGICFDKNLSAAIQSAVVGFSSVWPESRAFLWPLSQHWSRPFNNIVEISNWKVCTAMLEDIQ